MSDVADQFLIQAAAIKSDAANVEYNAANVMLENERLRGRPFILYRPKLYPDGDQWCALLGDNIQEGVCGFGKTPEEAAAAFDNAWFTELPALSLAADGKEGA